MSPQQSHPRHDHVHDTEMTPEDLQGVLAIADEWAETFKLIGDPTRFRLLLAIHYVGEDLKSVTELAEMTGVRHATASAALRAMENLRVVKGERVGRQVLYRLVDERAHQLLHAVGSGHAHTH